MPRELPTGTVTFLLTDVEGSTKLLHELGPERYAEALVEHRRVLREALAANGGVEVDTQGDAFFVAFPSAPEAVAAASAANDALAQGPIRVRMGIHTGTPHLSAGGYVGEDVPLGARIAASGHGRQVLLSKTTRELIDGQVTDLGEHRLKDFAEPVWIFQLGSEHFPPLKAISNTNLPRPASSFVGRKREVDEITSLLRDGTRLLTLTGPGGSGKTRLALETGAELVPEFKNGTFWVGLAALRDPALVSETIAQTMGAKDGLAEHIAERELLLLLDNLEQVAEAAPELAALVEACPNLRLLVTSRELLRVRGEVEYAVAPLAEPEAVELFCARAQLEPSDEIAELCRRLDDLPLAVELAAARTSVLSPAQILERLTKRLDLFKGGRDAEARQQTLRATIAWSYELLDEGEQRLFARVSVFAGGCTLEAAEEVCEAELDTLQSLVDKNLLRHTDERFWMLETIREYATELLEASAESVDLHRRHAEYFLALAEEAEPNIFGTGSPVEWLDELEREHDNLRAGLDYFEGAGQTQLALRLAGGLPDFWHMRGYLAEGLRRLEGALRADGRPTAARAKALNGAATIAIFSGDAGTGKARAEQALELHRRLGDTWGCANSLWALGYALSEGGDPSAAEPVLEESVGLFREVGDLHGAVGASRTLAFSYSERGELDRAWKLHSDNLRWAREIGNVQIEARSLGSLSFVAAEQGRVSDAVPLVKEAYRIDCQLGNRLELAVDIGRFAKILAAAGKAETAAKLLACSQTLCEELDAAVPWVTRMYEDILRSIRMQSGDAAVRKVWEEGRKLKPDEAVALALASLD